MPSSTHYREAYGQKLKVSAYIFLNFNYPLYNQLNQPVMV